MCGILHHHFCLSQNNLNILVNLCWFMTILLNIHSRQRHTAKHLWNCTSILGFTTDAKGVGLLTIPRGGLGWAYSNDRNRSVLHDYSVSMKLHYTIIQWCSLKAPDKLTDLIKTHRMCLLRMLGISVFYFSIHLQVFLKTCFTLSLLCIVWRLGGDHVIHVGIRL